MLDKVIDWLNFGQGKQNKPIGIVLWKGKSLIDGQRIMVIATGIFGKSTNSKTGEMIQTYIMKRDMEPMFARRMGEDFSICGDCKHKEQSTCYVNLCHGPMPVYKAYHDNSYKDFENKDKKHFKGKYIRIGSYGDPAAVPFEVWDNICKMVKGYTGYTHQWKNCDQRLKKYCMASVDSIKNYYKEYDKAQSMGWRTFRIYGSDSGEDVYDTLRENEFVCPASKEAGVKTDCQRCNSCSGTSKNTKKCPVILFHGDSEAMGTPWRLRRYMKLMKKIRNKKKYKRDYKAERKIFRATCKF